jgi:hypothetical protein
MQPDNVTTTRQRWSVLVLGAVLLVVSTTALIRLHPTSRSWLFWIGLMSGVTGLGMMVFYRRSRVFRLTRGIAWIGGLALIAEAGGRVLKIDFDAGRADRRAVYPVCFLEGQTPFAEVFFKRAGGESWTGKPLSTLLRVREATDVAYGDEAEFRSDYDRDGFRNPPDLSDWDAVLVGDSFTESGYLPLSDIFTSVAARKASLRVKNLGLCNIGALTETRFLAHFGKAPSCKVAVMAFCDGNDVQDALEETRTLAEFQRTGVRPSRETGPQRSLLKAIYQRVNERIRMSQAQSFANAIFSTGTRITMQGEPLPPDPATLSAEAKSALSAALDEWKRVCDDNHLRAALLYLPVQNRVYHGLMKPDASVPAALREWKPAPLPDYMAQLCAAKGIAFLDATPALRAEAERGVDVFNPILDTHLNRTGSRVVGEVLGAALRQWYQPGT